MRYRDVSAHMFAAILQSESVPPNRWSICGVPERSISPAPLGSHPPPKQLGGVLFNRIGLVAAHALVHD